MTNKTYILISRIRLIIILIIYIITPLHPIHILILLIIYNTILCLNISIWKSTSIFSILFFLIIIRSLLIIFLYFSRLISNEKTRIDTNNKIYLVFINLVIWIIFLLLTFYAPFIPQTTTPDLVYIPSPLYTHNNSSTTLLFNSPLLFLTLLNITFLFLSMFLIIKMCSPKVKPIRKIK